ncbi:ArnT family glycosyltransferase [Thiohalophilus sp.]|uniref:ArnT family glycosyltransferase n=1 Tax=Thiohalophilus sp. TaxID=3028392 RepID=UPI002ACDDA29|nr:glycosyltransferase family 39 protein [Thiohalophilus sp.]MDZ7663486.1 glycosyltransferase family 39 protein [Thiohalophilus sp.]
MLNCAVMNVLAPDLHFWHTRLWVYLLLTLVAKLVLAHYLPMTGDEAYFILWGNYPDYGYYDHPPMVGWLLSAMLAVSDAPLWLRLPQILLTSFIGLAIYLLLRRTHEAVAVAVAVLYLVAPVNVLGVLTTTDTPLIFWSFLSAVSFYFARRRDNFWWYLLCGLFLGAAFFSKFFAGLLGIAYFLYIVLYTRRGLRPYLGLLLIILGTLPFIGLNLWWNYNNCWNNYLFNLVNRTAGSGVSPELTLKYLVLLVYLVTPPILYYLIRQWREFRESLTSRQSVFGGLFFIPIGLFFLLSFWKSIGLHWLLSFYPFLFLALAPILSTQQLRKCFYFMLPFTILHLVLVGALLILAPGVFKGYSENTYRDVVLGMRTSQILEAAAEYEDFVLMTDSYSESALLAYHSGRHIPVFGISSYHGREDDKITDFRRFDGKNILVFSHHSKEAYRPYFRESTIKQLHIEQTHYHLFVGKGFDYQKYREEVLSDIVQRYYRIPDYLPVGSCYMYERYGFK